MPVGVELWRMSGIMQCVPIFAMALSCQTQVHFRFYRELLALLLHLLANFWNKFCCIWFLFEF